MMLQVEFVELNEPHTNRLTDLRRILLPAHHVLPSFFISSVLSTQALQPGAVVTLHKVC